MKTFDLKNKTYIEKKIEILFIDQMRYEIENNHVI